MKAPRGISADRLIRLLERLGYRRVRQKGSHVRLKLDIPVAHSITVPLHNPLKVGTLHAILAEVAKARGVDLESLIEQL